MSNFNFNIERYYLLNGYEVKNNYISSCLLPYTDESPFNHEGIVREIKSILIQIDEKFHTRAYLLDIPVGYEKNTNEDIKIYHELEEKLEHYCIIFIKARKFQEDGSFDFSEKQRAEHEKLLQPKTDSNGDILKFTFDDWVNNKFISEKDYLGNYVLNDSENYRCLVSKGNMSFKTWNKIQDAQEETYDILIEKTLKNSEDFLKMNLKNQTDAKAYIENLIYNQREYFENYKPVYDAIKFKTKHRGKKYGAKFITAKQYKERDKYQDLIAAYYPRSYYEPLLNMIDISCETPTKDQILYCQMEYRLKWVDYLEKYLLKEFSINKLNDLENAFDSVNFEAIEDNIKSHFASIPYDFYHSSNLSEGFFGSNLYSYLRGIKIKNNPEVHSAFGRADNIIERPNYIYCFEHKFDKTGDKALNQIFEKKYLDPYKVSGKQLIAIGINFSSQLRNIESFKFQILS